MKKPYHLLWLGLILSLGLFLRIAFIDWVPARLTVDEMSIGYNAYSILKTGKDEWGKTLPLVFQAFGDYKLPAYIYLSVPFVWMFGLSVFSVKLLSILCGVGLIFVSYLITNEITRSEKASLATALITTIAPWTIHLSRQALESHLALLFYALSLYFLLSACAHKNSWRYILSGAFLGFTLYTYVAYRLLALLLIPLFITYIGIKYSKHWMRFFLAFLVVVVPLSTSVFSAAGLARARQTSLFTDPGIVSAVNENRSFCYLVDPSLTPLCSLLFNKVTQVGSRFVHNYLSFFSTEFLFVSGDKNLYLNNPDNGELLWIFAPLLLLGMASLSKLHGSFQKLLFGTLLLAPLPAAISGTAQMVRSSALVLPLLILTGLGLTSFWNALTRLCFRRTTQVVFVFILITFTIHSLVSYFVIYPVKYDNAAYQLPTKVATFITQSGDAFEGVYFHHRFTDAHMFLAFYASVSPEWYQQNIVRPSQDGFGFSHPVQLGSYYFGQASFESLYCEQKIANFLFVSPEPVRVMLPDGKNIGYTTHDYRNFSGVHPQAQLIESVALDSFLAENNMTKESFCK